MRVFRARRGIPRCRALAAVLGLHLGASRPWPPTARDTVTRWDIGEWTIWRIDRPSAGEALREYPEIRFQPGDRVLIDAGGCVSTAGAQTLIAIPGLTDGPAALDSVLRRELRVPASAGPDPLVLRLGFSEAGRGRGRACGGQPDAYVMVGAQRALTGGVLPRPMDLVWDGSVDANGILRNPKWGLQQTHPGSIPDPVPLCFDVPGWFWNPVCTVQRPSVDVATDL